MKSHPLTFSEPLVAGLQLLDHKERGALLEPFPRPKIPVAFSHPACLGRFNCDPSSGSRNLRAGTVRCVPRSRIGMSTLVGVDDFWTRAVSTLSILRSLPHLVSKLHYLSAGCGAYCRKIYHPLGFFCLHKLLLGASQAGFAKR